MILTLAQKFKDDFLSASTEDPPEPGQLYSLNDDGTISGLREKRELYTKFLRGYGKAVCGRTFQLEAQTKTLSEFLPTSLEAFLVLCYENGYQMWKREAMRKKKEKEGNVGEEEEGTKDSGADKQDIGFKFTSNARGAKRAEGWSESGLELFNKIFDEIDRQRKGVSTTGLAFETHFLAYS